MITSRASHLKLDLGPKEAPSMKVGNQRFRRPQGYPWLVAVIRPTVESGSRLEKDEHVSIVKHA
jgi:hypothetical protein